MTTRKQPPYPSTPDVDEYMGLPIQFAEPEPQDEDPAAWIASGVALTLLVICIAVVLKGLP